MKLDRKIASRIRRSRIKAEAKVILQRRLYWNDQRNFLWRGQPAPAAAAPSSPGATPTAVGRTATDADLGQQRSSSER